MRRRIGAIGLACVVMVGSFGSVVGASDGPYPPRTAGEKLGRGLINVFTGFIEVPRNIYNTTAEDSLLSGWTVGLGKGVGYAALRMLVGLYEVVTFPFPVPKDFEPVVQPEFVWQAQGPRYVK